MSKLSLLAKYQSIPQGMTMHGVGQLLEKQIFGDYFDAITGYIFPKNYAAQ